MAAYGALVSVMQIIDQIHHHPCPPISLHKEQVESLNANLTFLQQFLEGYTPHVSYNAEADPLESRIAGAAYAAEDAIESFIVDQILARSTNRGGKISSIDFCQGLGKVIEEMDLIKMDIKKMKMKEKKMAVQIKRSSTNGGGAYRSSSTTQKASMIGLDDVLYEILDKIAGGERGRQIIPIVGMGGIRKTTLARNIFANPLIKEHFDFCAWSTISQVHNAPKILSEILGRVKQDNWGDLSVHELGEKLYKYLIGRRYLIVMDDMWSVEAWDAVRSFFPDNGNGSKIVVTTRLSNLASEFNYSNGLDLKFMDEATSWNLFSKTVFGDEICPLELEDIGMKIVEGCKGLPLSIVVVGGLLSKSEATREHWHVIEKNLSSIVNSEDNESCLQTLYMSYNNLLVYIKPCNLYLGVFPEDNGILVGLLIPLWVAEGIIKPCDGKSLEEVGEEYLEELVDRNLLLVEERNHYGKLELCKMHDLLRDLCLREGEKDKFLCVFGVQSIPQSLSCQRRIATSFSREYPPIPLLESLAPAASPLRSLIGKFHETMSISSFKMLRVGLVLNSIFTEEEKSECCEEIVWLVNLRLLVDFKEHPLYKKPSLVSFLWNLQTLCLDSIDDDYVLEIWEMPLLRHLIIYNGTLDGAYCLPDHPLSGDSIDMDGVVVMKNLQTLYVVRNLKFGERLIKRIPNIKMLKLEYAERGEELGDFCLNNLHRLHKLQVLRVVGGLFDSQLMQEQLTAFSQEVDVKRYQAPLGRHEHKDRFLAPSSSSRTASGFIHWIQVGNIRRPILCSQILAH